jgi:hypothetical protein
MRTRRGMSASLALIVPALLLLGLTVLAPSSAEAAASTWRTLAAGQSGTCGI